MLQNLYIKGLAIVNELSIEFGQGFNVITGETGAGKSILIKALSILLGDKVSKDVVRNGEDFAVVCAVFLVPLQDSVSSRLEDLGISYETTTENRKKYVELIVRRKLFRAGKSQSFLNDQPITMGQLKTVMEPMVDIFAQHDSRGLLNPKNYLNLVDLFLTNKKVLVAHQQAFQELNTTWQEFKKLIGTSTDPEELEFLKYRYAMVEELDPSLEDYKNLSQSTQNQQGKLKSVEKVAVALDNFEAEDFSVMESLKKSLKALAGLEDHKESHAKLSRLVEELDGVQFGLSSWLEQSDFSAENYDEMQARLSAYQEMLRKFRANSVEEFLTQVKSLSDRIEFCENRGLLVEKISKRLASASKKVRLSSQKLHAERLKVAKSIQTKIERELKHLAMPHCQFVCEWKSIEKNVCGESSFENYAEYKGVGDAIDVLTEVDAYGSHVPLFLLSANPGEKPKPLHKVASGGEMSRVMLAIKRVLLHSANVCLLVFDEIDTGISGEVADVVGQKLKDLGSHFQVLCISHLPQVAAYANEHYLVKKQQSKKQTSTTIEKLTNKNSVQELARLLSGGSVSKSAVANAKNLKTRASGSKVAKAK